MSIKNRIFRALALRWLRGKLLDLRGKEKESGMGKVLKFLDGWKLMIAVVAIASAKAWDMAHNGHTGDFVGIALSLIGYTPGADWIALARDMGTHLVAVAAIIHKLVKAKQQADAGATVSELLGHDGYVKAAIAKELALPRGGDLGYTPETGTRGPGA